MAYRFKSPESEQEWHDYYQLRWQILRQPWQQPPGSEQDEQEDSAFHIMTTDEADQIVGVGRIHRSNNGSAQIRYMAVHPAHQGKGVGGQILALLEQQAHTWDCAEVILNARIVSLPFYLHHDYQIVGDGPTLFGSIAHKYMRKLLV